MLPLLALALLAAEPPVQVLGQPARAHVEGETDTFLWIEAHEELRLQAQGPGRLVLDLRGWAKHPVPSVSPAFAVSVDGQPVAVPPIKKPANRKVEAPGGFASTSTLLPIELAAGRHLVRIRDGRGSPGLVSSTFIPDEADFLPAPKPQPQAQAEPPVPVVAAPEDATLAARPEPSGPTTHQPWALEVAAGGATQVQLGGLGPMVGLAAETQLGPDRQLALGIAFDYLRVPLEIIQPLPQPSPDAHLTGAASSAPVLVRASWRPMRGDVEPFVGIGAGVTFASVSIAESSASRVLPAAEVRGGVDIWAGPGQVVVQARVLAAQGDFHGVAEHFQAGGAAAQVGYRFEL